MNTRGLLTHLIANEGLCPGSSTLEQWLDASWVRVRVADTSVPVLPLWGLKKAFVVHDVHHAVLGYDTTLRGEVEIAAWELASGGCAWNLPFWFDRILAVMLGSLAFPRSTWRALRRGWGRRNLYGVRVEEILAADVGELRERLG